MTAERQIAVEGETLPVEMNCIRDVADALRKGETFPMDVSHSFTRDAGGKVNRYTRGCLMLPGRIYISEKHRTEHPWFMIKGDCWVFAEETGWVHFVGTNSGITKPGAQRILWILEPTVWATSHETFDTDLKALEERIIEPTDIERSMEWVGKPNLEALL